MKADENRRAVQRGPLVYCVEQVDNNADVETISLSDSTCLMAAYQTDLLDGVVVIDGKERTAGSTAVFRLIPYYAWDNRESGKMAVWLPYMKKENGFQNK